MRKTKLYLLFCLAFLSCKKEQKEIVVVNPSPYAIYLPAQIDPVINDSTITVKWTKFTGTNFQKYRLVRTANYVKNGQFASVIEPVDSSNDINHTSFTENKMPFARDIYYTLYLSRDTTLFNQGYQPVGGVAYQRPRSLLYGIPTDVLIDSLGQKLFVTEANKISVVDYTTGRILVEKDFPVSIGYCSLGNYNGSKELYVPENDGWLLILDAVTLQQKDKIYVAGYGIGSVVTVNGKLFVSSSDKSWGYSDCVKVYERATKALIARTGYWDNTRLVHLEGGSAEMIDLTIGVSPIDLSYYQFSAEGVTIVKKQDQYHGDYSMDSKIVRSFPDGSKFITSSSGTIFNKSLVFDRYIKQNGSYSDFAFNTEGSIIYAAYGSQKKIDAVAYPTTTNISSYSTEFYPYKIFRVDNSLICVGKPNTNTLHNYLFVEKITL